MTPTYFSLSPSPFGRRCSIPNLVYCFLYPFAGGNKLQEPLQ
jgi:hypothetical protein